jgi:hypothetical protein
VVPTTTPTTTPAFSGPVNRWSSCAQLKMDMFRQGPFVMFCAALAAASHQPSIPVYRELAPVLWWNCVVWCGVPVAAAGRQQGHEASSSEACACSITDGRNQLAIRRHPRTLAHRQSLNQVYRGLTIHVCCCTMSLVRGIPSMFLCATVQMHARRQRLLCASMQAA